MANFPYLQLDIAVKINTGSTYQMNSLKYPLKVHICGYILKPSCLHVSQPVLLLQTVGSAGCCWSS